MSSKVPNHVVGPEGAWPFHGRSPELDAAASGLVDREGVGIVIAGNPGVGKSRLAREAAARAREAGAQVLTAVATRAAAEIPFGSLAHLMPAIPLGRDPDRFALFGAAATAIAERAAGAPVVLFVDDAHALDPAGAALVLHLATTGAVAVLATVRNGEAIPDAVRALWKDAGAARIDVEPFDLATTVSLLEIALGDQVDETTAVGLHELARGNALYLREVVDASLEHQTLTNDDGVWHWNGEVPRSQRLDELVEARIGRLEPHLRRVLEIVAIGEPLGARNLAELAEPADVAELERRGLVSVVLDGRREVVALAHPLHGEVLRPQIPATSAHELRLALAQVVEDRGMRRRTDLLRVATWRLRASGAGDPELFTQAALACTRAFDPALGLRLARAALEGGAGVRAALALSEAHLWQSESAAANDALAGIDLHECGPDVARHALFHRVLALHWGLGRSAEADAALRSALDLYPSESWRQQINGLRAQALAFDGPLEEAVALAEPMVHDPSSDGWARFYGVNAVVTRQAFSGQTDDALATLEPYDAVARELVLGFPHGPSWIVALRGATLMAAGRLDEADELLTGLRDLAVSVDDDQSRGGALMGLGLAATYRGRLRDAVGLLRQAIAPLERSDIAGLLPWNHALLARVLGELGDSTAAGASLRAFELTAASRPRNRLHIHDDIAGHAWTLASGGELTRAREVALAGAEELAELAVHEAHLLVTALRLGEPPTRVGPRLVELGTGAQSATMQTWAVVAAALLDGGADQLSSAADALEELGHLLHAAELRVAAAAAFREEGRTDPARRAAAAASTLLSGPCSGAATPGLAGLQAPSLTSREREVAHLASEGLSNGDIADKLVVSVRTVEWHLEKVYAKLGVSGRGALAEVLR